MFFMKFILYILIIGLWIPSALASHSTKLLQTSYYIADTVECWYIEYTCEHGYQKFTDTKGCGCSPQSIETGNTQYYIPQNTTSAGSSYYIPQNFSTRDNSGYCGHRSWEVCGAPKNTCTDSRCPILHPRTYANVCQMQAVGAQYLYEWECQTHNRLNYNTYWSQYYRDDYYSNDEDYLMYLVREFIYKLERKNYSDRTTITTIDRVIQRLEELGDRTRQYQNASIRAIYELESYRERVQDRDIIDRIEDIFDRY